MLALEAAVVVVSARGEREIPVASFFTGLFSTDLQPDEILKEIRVPAPPPMSGGAYLKLERKVGDYATAGVAVQITVDSAGVCQRAGVGLTNVGFTPLKAAKVEAFLKGRQLDEAAIKQASEIAASESQPFDDVRGSADYKRDVVRVLSARALRRALERARGGA
jgi:carbon-monoxide dehydrogenase medium subunit